MTNTLRPLYIFALLILIIPASPYPASITSPSHEEDLSNYKNFIDKAISPKRIDGYLKYFTEKPYIASCARNNKSADFVLREWNAIVLKDLKDSVICILFSTVNQMMMKDEGPSEYELQLVDESLLNTITMACVQSRSRKPYFVLYGILSPCRREIKGERLRLPPEVEFHRLFKEWEGKA